MSMHSRRSNWSPERMPDLSNRTVVVTGANSGLGLEASVEFARKGAHVVLACRNERKAHEAISEIRDRHSEGTLEFIPLDLASLASVKDFASECLSRHPRIHVLCNNAGIMAIPRRLTSDGFEMQFGTNHLGHFALTARLFGGLLAAESSRIVCVSSNAHKAGRIDFDDPQSERRYGRWRSYGQSKLANLLFAYELDRRLKAKQHAPIALAAHPGYAATNLQFVGPAMDESGSMERVMRFGNAWFSQSAAMGARPTLYAATSADVTGGEYVGPSGFAQMTGAPRVVASSRRSHDRDTARRLWALSEELTGLRFEGLE